SAGVAGGRGNIWDSGTRKSKTNLAVYEGRSLEPFTKYYWSVRIRDGSGRLSKISETASFETGMMEAAAWKGSWISDSRDINLKPAACFRKSFRIPGRIKSARAYIAAAGLYELTVNGVRAGDHLLDPAYTRFDRRNLYVTHDITELLREGENAAGVLMGNGWYNHQSTAVWFFHEAPWRARPSFCMEIHISLEDGSSMIIPSGTDWKTATGPVIFNSIYTAEHYDARQEKPGWDLPGYDDSYWKEPVLVPAPSQNITAQAMHPIRAEAELSAKRLNRINSNTWVYDFGRNIAGVTRLRISGSRGTVIRLKHGERLMPDGRVDQSNIDVHYRPADDSDPFQTDIFILAGRGEEVFMPRFNYKGFQYVELTSDRPVQVNRESLSAFFMHSDVPPAGYIKSSDTLLNRIWEAANNSYLSNLFGYPTDCPQREKNGWTGDAHIAVETGLYNFDAVTVYEKWLNDHLDEQQPNGVLPAIIPTSGWGYHWANGPDWTSTIAIIPWNIYLFYGDPHLLNLCYDNIKRYVDHITELSPDGLTDWGLGDWIPVKSVSPKELTSSIYYFVDACILAKAARLFGNDADHEKYSRLAQKIKDAVNEKYLDREKGIYGSGFQTEMSFPLMWGIVPDEFREVIASNLAESVRANDYHIDVGLHGTKSILNALSENGYPDIAFRLAVQDTFPSWGWWIVNGATTMFENWPINPESDISMNHIMFGEISAWMYKALGGIFPDEDQPGFKNVILKPHFVDGLDKFEARHDGPYGTIISSWEKAGDRVVYRITLPPGSTATFYPGEGKILEQDREVNKNRHIVQRNTEDGRALLLGSGKYEFTIQKHKAGH
ncbi:MAG TPA: family 78 glycoside hydrolase catalytic domain, partial [Bacteroidales bacterium]|nr:family 78 glycoside hydrolase catalytic domain [Bacteroidales bacterium]